MPEFEYSKCNLLSATSRRFYSKRKPSQQIVISQHRITKVMKALNSSCGIRKVKKVQNLKTQGNHNIRFSQQICFNQTEFIKKQLTARLQILMRKADKKWKLLYESYQDLKACNDRQAVLSQQNTFYRILSDLLKQSVQKDKNLITQRTFQRPLKTGRDNKFTLIELQNLKLLKENELLQNKYLQSMKHQQKQNQNPKNKMCQNTIFNKVQTQELKINYELSSQLKQQIKQQNQKIFLLENENVKMKQNLVSLQNAVNTMKEDKIQLSLKVAQFKGQNEKLNAQLIQLRAQSQNSKQKFQKWRYTIAFQKEQIISYEAEITNVKNEYKDLHRKYQLLLKRMNKVNTHTSTKIPELNTKYYEIFNEQIQTFSKVRTIFYNKESESYLDKTIHSKQSADIYKNYLSDKETANNSNGLKRLNRQHYAYFKPNFYNFVQNYMDLHGIDGSTIQQINIDVSIDFLTNVRAILDSKFNQFLEANFKNISSFSSFTYAWLSKFKIHKKKKCIIEIKQDINKQVIPTFFITLMSERLNSNWQIITFRELLMDTLTLDQLYFYLMARHYIFKGNLLNNINGVYQEICYVNISQAIVLLHKFISDCNYRKKIEQYLKKFIIYVRKRPLIDVHFILRILLQFYQFKKHQEFTNLYNFVQSFSQEKITSFSFQNFMRIFEENFTYLSLTDKLEIYKKCFSCSRGKINIQTILTVLTQQGYLCNEVKKIFLNDQIRIIKSGGKNEEDHFIIEPSMSELHHFELFFRKFMKTSFQNEKLNLGLQSIIHECQAVKQFNQSNMFQRIKFIFKLNINCLEKMFYTKKIELFNFMPLLSQVMSFLQRLNKITCQKREILDLMTLFKRQGAARKIIRFYRKKKNQMHRNFGFNSKDQNLEINQKMNNIRNQFNSMISNLRSNSRLKTFQFSEYY